MRLPVFKKLKGAKLRTKLCIDFMIVAILPVFILGAISYDISKNSLHDQLENRLIDYVERSGTQLNVTYSRFQEALDQIAYDDELLMRVYALQNNLMQSGAMRLYMDQKNDVLQSLSASIQQLDLFMGGDVGLMYNNQTLYKQVEKALAAHPDNMEMYKNKGVFCFWSENQIYMVRSVYDFYGNREAAKLVLTLNKRVFFNEVFMGNAGSFGIIVSDNQGGSVINLVGELMPTGVVPVGVLKNMGPDKLVVYNNLSYLCDEYPLDMSNWRLYAVVSYQSVLNGTNNIIKITITAMLAGTGLLAIIAFLISSSFTNRIEFLIKQMKKVSTGDMLIEAGDQQGDEISQLGLVFENMVAKLETLIQDVYVSQIARRESEFKALQTQINPHFLYNCLDNMNWYAIIRGDDHSSYIITQLSDFYRTSLNCGKNTLTVNEELKNAVAYMNLQLELHDNNFDFEKEIDEGIGHYLTINLMLQPILENAVKHGVDKSDNKQIRNRVCLTAKREGQRLKFTVYNTGVVITQEVIQTLLVKQTKGYGLRNVNERIKLMFGSEYGIHIAPAEGGTVCEIVIPQITELENQIDKE